MLFRSSEGHVQVCQLIFNYITDFLPQDNYGFTPLHEAAAEGHVEVIKLFLENPKVVDKNPGNLSGQTPLHLATLRGFKDVCQLLLNHVKDKLP